MVVNGDGDNIVAVVVSSILSLILLNHPTPFHFSDNPRRLHRFDHHSDEIQVIDKKINNQPRDDIGKIGAHEETRGSKHDRRCD